MVSQYFFIHFTVWYGNCPVGHNMLGETGKRLCKDAGIEGQFTNHSLRTTTATGGLQKEIPDKFVMERTEPRDVRSLQKYQRPDTSSKKVRLLWSRVTTQVSYFWKGVNKTWSRVDEEEVKDCSKFLKGCNEAGTSATFYNCTVIVSKDFKL